MNIVEMLNRYSNALSLFAGMLLVYVWQAMDAGNWVFAMWGVLAIVAMLGATVWARYFRETEGRLY